MTRPMQQNPDGSWSEAQPLGWQGAGIDWEIYGKQADGHYLAKAYDEDMLVEVVAARTRLGLALGIRRAKRKLKQAG